MKTSLSIKLFLKPVQFILLGAAALVLSSCNDPEVTGKLVLHQAVNLFKETKNKPVAVEIASGEYNAVARLRENNKKLYLTITDSKSNPIIKFDLPGRFPDLNGEFRIPSKLSGQPYGLHGIVKSESQDSPTIAKWEPCFHSCVPGGGSPNPGGNCYPENGQSGYQRVRYHMTHTQTQYDVDLENLDNSVAGAFHAAQEYSEKVYEFKGNCL